MFFQAAYQRLEDASILFRYGRNTGAMYLAGYAVECMLKALLLDRAPTKRRTELNKDLRGSRAHDFGWLKEQYLAIGGDSFPKDVNRDFVLVNSWRTDLRYFSGSQRKAVTQSFLRSAESIVKWANERL